MFLDGIVFFNRRGYFMQFRILQGAMALSLLLFGATTSAVAGIEEWTEGHGDIGIAYEDGWDLHIHAEGATIGGVEYPDEEFEAGDVRIVVPALTEAIRPGGAEWAPIGLGPGQSFWSLSQTEVVGAPYVGFGTEEILAGDFVGDQINLTLTNVVSPSGTGVFSLYQTDLFGDPTFAMSNFNGLDGSDVLSLNADDHVHTNLAFNETGLWAVTFEASGTHSVDGFVSGEGTYFFRVVPEPATAFLTAVGCLLALRRRTR